MNTAEKELTNARPLQSEAHARPPMKALVYHGPGKRAWEEKLRPTIKDAADAIVRITTSTICGTDLHILKGDLPAVADGRVLGYEGIGIVENVGSGVFEKLWDRNITLTTRLVDTVTTPMLLKVVQSGKLQPRKLVTHRFALNDVMKAYDTFGNAAREGALKVILKNDAPR